MAIPSMAGTYCVEPGSATDTVHFQSSAKLEFVDGITSNISGSIVANLDSMSLGAAGTFQVDLRTLKTGIDLRDEHMRGRHLHTEKYPYAFFRIDSVTECPQALKFDSTYQLHAKGKFFLHGVWRPIMVTAELRRAKLNHDSESLYVTARFALKLDEFGVPRPKALFLKLAETINVEVIFTAGNNLASPSISLPDWPERK
jgi:polyisoprenoid-binding protein YceI